MRPSALAVLVLIFAAAAQEPAAPTASQIASVRSATFGQTDPKSLKDYTATGTITFFAGDQQESGSFTIRAIGSDFLRCDAELPSGTRIWVIDGLQGHSKFGDRKAVTLSLGVTSSLRNYFFPAGVLARAKQDTLSTANRNEIKYSPALKNLPEVEYSLAPETALLTKSRSDVSARQGAPNIRQEYRYSQYREINGIRFPSIVEEWLGETLISRAQIEKVELNTGLTRDQFKLEDVSARGEVQR